jgi:hypothetical protein
MTWLDKFLILEHCNVYLLNWANLYGNVSGANQPLYATVQTSNLGHMMLIQEEQ